MLNKKNQLKQRCELMLKKLSQRFLFIGLTSKVTNSAHLNLCVKANLKSRMKFYCIWTDAFLCAGWKSQNPDQQLWKNRLENNCQFFACKYSAEAKSVELCLSFPWICKCKSLNANQCLHVELSSSWLIKTFPVALKGADRIPVYAPLEKAPGSWFDKRLLVQRGRWKGGKITPKIW